MSRRFDGVAEAPESAPLEWVWTPGDTFVPLDDEGATSAAAPGPALLRAQWELARRGLGRGVRCSTVGGRLLVHEADEERALDLVDVAVELGWTCVDRNTAEVTHPLALGDESAIGHALEALAAAEDGYLIVEGGEDLACYVQALRLDDELLLEAASREHVARRPGVRLERLRWLGFTRPAGPRRNAAKLLGRDLSSVPRTVTRALEEVYGLPRGAPLRLRTNGL